MPDASAAFVAVSHPDVVADAYSSQIWRVPLGGGDPRRFTRGQHDSDPVVSPDGELLAFLRSGKGSAPQLFVMPVTGGDAVQVTDEKFGVSNPVFSPDSRRIAFISSVVEEGRYGTVEGISAEAESPRRMTTLKYRANGVGYTSDRARHVFVVPVPDLDGEPYLEPAPVVSGEKVEREQFAKPIALTSGEESYRGISWHPSGERIIAVTARHETRDLDLVGEIVAIDAQAEQGESDTRELLGAAAHLSPLAAVVAENGDLWFVAQDMGESGVDFVGRNAGLYLAKKGEEPRRLTAEESVDLGDIGSSITLQNGAALVLNRVRGFVRLERVASDGELTTIIDEVEVTGVTATDDVIAASFANLRTAGDLMVVRGGETSVVTDFSRELADDLVIPTELDVEARDGSRVHGWVFVPEGDGPHPVLLNIHGGPFAAYAAHVFDEAQVYVEAGYAVVMCNPRGSAGYGEKHGQAIKEKMGTVDMTDVLDFLDAAIRDVPGLDGDRVGIMGGSYGGYLTAWTIAHDHRFRGAIVERGYLDPEAFVGTSDIGGFFSDQYVGTDPKQISAQSPQAVVGDVTTPTLVLHSELDFRCPLSQGERYYAALKRQGIETELLIFPGENHELSRSGRPKHRVERFDAILDWWRRYLPVSGA